MLIYLNEASYISMDEVMERINIADCQELQMLIEAVIHKHDEMFPNWKFAFLSIPADPVKREEQMEQIIKFIRDYV